MWIEIGFEFQRNIYNSCTYLFYLKKSCLLKSDAKHSEIWCRILCEFFNEFETWTFLEPDCVESLSKAFVFVDKFLNVS